jgi:hypothetical protein
MTKLDTPCVEWDGYRNPAGYGQVRVDGVLWLAHRRVWFEVNGPIPEGLIVMHRCDNPACIRPSHLLLGTHAQNVADKIAKGRGNEGSKHGNSKLSEEEVAEIRRLRKESKCTLESIGRKFGVNKSCISRILNGTRRSNSYDNA